MFSRVLLNKQELMPTRESLRLKLLPSLLIALMQDGQELKTCKKKQVIVDQVIVVTADQATADTVIVVTADQATADTVIVVSDSTTCATGQC